MRFALLWFALAACPKSDQKRAVEPSHPPVAEDGGRQLLPAGEAGIAALPPAPALPELPLGLPPPPRGVLEAITPEAVALGALLFTDPRLGTGKLHCASCHDLANRLTGVPGKQHTQRDPKTPPQLENLAWNPRAIAGLPAHFSAEMGQDLASAAHVIALVPGYQPHLARVGGTPEQAVTQAITGFLLTRYDADAPWDHQERAAAIAQDPVAKGYRLFIGKAKCGTCHVPPLYTDGRTHDTGFGGPTPTRSLRGVARRAELFSDGSAHSLEEALDHYTNGHPERAATPNHELVKVNLTPLERADLLAFLQALTGVVPTAFLEPLP